MKNRIRDGKRRTGKGRALLVALGAAVPIWALSCSSSSRPGALQNPPPNPTVDSGPYVPPRDAGHADTAMQASEGGATDAPLGNLATVDEPNVPCVSSGGTKTTLFAATGAGAPVATILGNLGTSRVGSAYQLGGFFTFDPSGTNPTYYTELGSLSMFGSEGTTVGGVAVVGTSVVYQRYDAQGNTVGSQVTLGSVPLIPDGLWLGTGGGTSLAIWSAKGVLSAAGVDSAGNLAGPAWTLAPSVTGANVAITYAGTHFAVVWSTTPTPTTSAAFFAFADPTGLVQTALSVEAGGTSFNPTALTKTPTGFALLAQGEGGDNHVYVLPLDPSGKPVPPAHRLLGSDAPWAITSLGTQLGLVASSDDLGSDADMGSREPMFRPLDATGHPLGPWVCLDGPISPDQTQDMAIIADTTGYSVVFKSVANEEVLTRINPLGTGAQ